MSSKIGGKFYRRTDVKMALWYIFTFFFSTLIICTFLYFRMKHQFIKEVDRFLFDEIKELSDVLSSNSLKIKELKNYEIKEVSRTYYPIYFRILDINGSPLYTSNGFKEIEYKLSDKVMSNVRNDMETRENIHAPKRRRPFRIITIPFHIDGDPTYIIQVGTHLHFVRKSLSNFKHNIMAVFPIILLLGAIGGWILAKRSLSPIGYIASKTQSITSNNLSDRLTPRGTNDEMDDLIRTINGMIERIEGSFKRITEFTTDVSHELKTPICAMRGEAEVLLSKERTALEYQEGLELFIERFDQLNRMINDLILLSKFDSSQIKLELRPVCLDILIKDIVEFLQVIAEQKEIRLAIHAFRDIDITVMGDKLHLQQLFTNLIDNAIKYTLRGGSIQVALEKDEKAAFVMIKDTGIGIVQEEQKNIFRRFYRVDKSRSREAGGVGLGLSIAEWIAQAHHGKIKVESELNKGSTFTVLLPLLEV